MERAPLEQLIAQEMSLADIAKRFGCHESTVHYWVKKHGLVAANRQRHAARGGLDRDQLESLVGQGMSVREIAAETGRSKSTVRHWLARYALKTSPRNRHPGLSTRDAKARGAATLIRTCRRHGPTEFGLEGRGYYRCKRCRAERVSQRRRKVKQTLVAEAGGRCVLCGYRRCLGALHFHHVDRQTKVFHLSMQGFGRSLAAARAEMAKCVLLCANCHAEVEQGIAHLPVQAGSRPVP